MTFGKKENSVWPGFPKNDPSVYYVFFKDKIVDTGRKKWLDLLSKSTYEWFWKVYSGSTSAVLQVRLDYNRINS